jgi:phosphoribosylformylglycinamidine synthase subunit PurL
VPLREPDLEPVEIMISESQERMVCTVALEAVEAVRTVCRKWELDCTIIGEVTRSGELRAFFHGEQVGTIPAAALTKEAPRYHLDVKPRALAEPIEHRPTRADAEDLLALLASPNIRSRRPVFERYDHLVGSRTVRRPGLDAAVLRLRPSMRGLAVSLDGAGRLAYLDPRGGGSHAVLEAARNVACAGGRPLAITDCLNFGNPDKAEIAWELQEVIEGMAAACEALRIPVVSGNVSLYNETDGRPIYPTPVVGCVGLVADVRRVPGAWCRGDAIFVVGPSAESLDGSEYQARFLGGPAGRPPVPNLALEAALVAFLWRSAPLLTSAHDTAEGGLAVALAELALLAGVGARVDIEEDIATWFGEGAGRAIVTCRPEDESILEGMPNRRIGTVGGPRLLGAELDEIRAAYEAGVAD